MYLLAAGPRVFLRKTGAGAENADGEWFDKLTIPSKVEGRFGGEIGL